MKGYIKDHRQELLSDIWLMPPIYHRVWQYLKYKANHKDMEIPMSDGSKFLIRRGQHLTSIRNIAQGVGWYEGLTWKEPNPKTISNILEWLVEQNMITIDRGKSNRQYTLITLVNYEVYQDMDIDGVTVDGEGSKQQLDINKNEKNEINNNSQVYKTIISYLNEKTGKRFSYKSAANQKLINGRLAEGRTVEDFMYVIDVKCDHWLEDEKMNEYLRPSTLFAQKNFENYLNQKPRRQQIHQDPRDKEIALQQWIQEGNDPDEFDWRNN